MPDRDSNPEFQNQSLACYRLHHRARRYPPHGGRLFLILGSEACNPEDPADEKELERVWQDAQPLAECCRRVAAAVDADSAVREQLRDFPTLRDRIDELGRIAAWAADGGMRIRLTYTMD